MRNLKRALSLALASVMLLGMMVVGTSASYADVSSKNNLEAIEVLKAVGVMTGDDKGNFNPDANVTRNEMAVIMCNLLGLKAGGSHPFTDVPAWAQGYVAACYNNGIIAGVSANKFSGDANVTAVQASLMVMKALGYFGFAGEFGDNWKLSTVKQANKIDLYDGINAYTDQVMTRNDVAQLVLNALESNVMIVTEEGGLTVDGNGITVSVKPTYDYNTPAKNNDGPAKDYRISGGDAIMQLCEKLYGNDLRKNGDVNDDFGRPAHEWTYHTTSIKCADEATLTYTDAVKGKTIYADLGKPSKADVMDSANAANKYDLDGNKVAVPTNFALKEVSASDDDTVKIGAKGATTEVYYDKNSGEVNIVVINTYAGKVTKVKDSNGKYELTIDVKNKGTLSKNTIEVEGSTFAKDDYVLVTKINSEIKSVVKATKVEGKVTAVKGNDYIKVDGTKYDIGNKFYNVSSSNTTVPGVDAKLVAYVGADGVLYAVDAQDASKDYLYVKDAIQALDGVAAKVVFADGTEKKIDVTKVDSTEGSALVANDVKTGAVYTYTVDKDEYTLTSVASANKENTTGADGEIKKGSANITVDASDSKTYTAGNNTVFVDVENNKVYTGYKNVPSFTGVNMYAVKNATSGLADIVFIVNGVDSTSGDTIFYVKSASFEETKVDGATYREYTVYVNGVEQKLTTKNMTNAANLTDENSTLQADTLYVAKKITAEGYLTAFDKTKSFAVTTAFDTENAGNVKVAKDGVLTIDNADHDKSGATKTTFTYDDKTTFVVVTDKKGATKTDTVEVGSVNDIVLQGKNVTTSEAESIVYILSVGDKTDDTPMATLVLVVVPQS